jgi:phosphatidylglycerophosphate synthase
MSPEQNRDEISQKLDRRPIATRSTKWAKALAAWLAQKKVDPNMISVAGILFAVYAGNALYLSRFNEWMLILAMIAVQMRLLCNMMDGMVAVEHQRKTSLGPLYNEIPDRISDIMIIVALGYSCQHVVLGWCGALFAVGTAYVRLLGGLLVGEQNFCGPQSKSQRMALITVACLLQLVIGSFWPWRSFLELALWGITIGSLITCWRRLTWLADMLNNKNEE